MDSLTDQGIADIRAGNIQSGNQLLRKALEQDPDDLQAWLALSNSAETDRERVLCLENVLRIQPEQAGAKAWLAKLTGTTGTPQLQPLPEDQNRKPPKRGLPLWLWLVGIILLGCLVFTIFLAYLRSTNFQKQISAQSYSIQLTLTQVLAPSATITATVTQSITPIATSTPTPIVQPAATLSATPSFEPPNSGDAASMKSIQQEVSDLRGLSFTAQVPAYIIDKQEAVSFLANDLVMPDTYTALQNEKQAQVAFGLITPTYNLENHIINRMVNGANGIYLPWYKQILIVGSQFGDVEKYTYAQEFDQALIDQNFDLGKIGLTKACIYEDERCQAGQALVEGDALLLQSQWLKQYASAHQLKTLANYKPALQILADQNTPAYLLQDLDFPNQYGLAFVNALFKKGGWAQVDQAYQNPPQTTGQIMQPDKYLSGVSDVPVNDTSLDKTLGNGWKLIQSKSFGEWSTYLLLAYGTDAPSRVDAKTAQAAVAGWVGDQYQVLYNAAEDQTALAAHWIWDTPPDAVLFQQAMQAHLSKLYLGSQLSSPKGQCWQGSDQIACLYTIEGQALWLQGPDTQTVDTLLAQFPDFNQ